MHFIKDENRRKGHLLDAWSDQIFFSSSLRLLCAKHFTWQDNKRIMLSTASKIAFKRQFCTWKIYGWIFEAIRRTVRHELHFFFLRCEKYKEVSNLEQKTHLLLKINIYQDVKSIISAFYFSVWVPTVCIIVYSNKKGCFVMIFFLLVFCFVAKVYPLLAIALWFTSCEKKVNTKDVRLLRFSFPFFIICLCWVEW